MGRRAELGGVNNINNREEVPLGARQKLNSVYLTIAVFVAGVLGLVTQSIVVFVICLGVLAGALLHDGTIRPGRTRK